MTYPPEALRLPAHLLENARVLSDRDAILPLLPQRRIIAEVGVGLGDWTNMLMRLCNPTEMIGIDDFKLHEQPSVWNKTADEHFGLKTHEEAFRIRFATELASGQLRLLVGDSALALEALDDESVDIIYIDADHHYESVRRDLAVARCKVRRDGWIILNDYIMVDTLHATIPYGVVHATNEFMVEHDWAMQYFVLQPRMYCDVVLRPARCLSSPTAVQTTQEENDRLRHEVLMLRASRSWQLTAPLRLMKRFTSSQRTKKGA